VSLRRHILLTGFLTLFLVSYTMLVDMLLVLLVLVRDMFLMVVVLGLSYDLEGSLLFCLWWH
jgi:hypothetical protein